MTKQETPRVISVRHDGLGARDPAALGGFYRDPLGLQVVGGCAADTSAARGSYRPDAIGRSTRAGRGGVGGVSERPVRSGRRGTGALITLPEEQLWAPAGFGKRVRVLVVPEQTGGTLTALEWMLGWE
jgi:hypothetical protein